MPQSITTDVNVHLIGRTPGIECTTLTTDSGRPFDLLTIGPVRLYASKDQLRSIRDAIIEHLVDSEEIPFDDAPDAIVTRHPGYWTGLATNGITPLPQVSGGCDVPPVVEPTFEPSPSDWAEYRELAETCDRLDQFNAARLDA